SSAPLGVPRSKSTGSDQTSRLVSLFVNAKAPPGAQEGDVSSPAPVVNLLTTPLTLPVPGDMPISHRLFASPVAAENTTALMAADHPSGLGKVPRGGFRPAWTSASCTPVFTASPPLVATSHQSIPASWSAFADV